MMKVLSSWTLVSFLSALGLSEASPSAETCTPAAIPFPDIFGAQIISLAASPVLNYSLSEVPLLDQSASPNVTSLNFCNVSIHYTHPGQHDSINVEVWLPLTGWNGRFVGVGGGGYATGVGPLYLGYPVSRGYAAVNTDGGHLPDPLNASSWALSSPGNVNWALLQDFAAIALDEAATIGKNVTAAYYGSKPKYSYWNGCSTGGRQGLMMAQRYPSQYDGILARSPAINWDRFAVADFWPQLVMNQLGTYPLACEFKALTSAAIKACDQLDGVADGIIAAPGLCHFDPHTVVGQPFKCSDTGADLKISSEAATIALAAWTGPRSVDGHFLFYGLNKDASLLALVNTTCSSNSTCRGEPFSIASDWIQYFVQKDPSFDLTNVSYRQYDTIFRQSQNQYTSIIGTNDPDLTDFKEAGRKMITWHGLADELISVNGTIDYYRQVLELDPGAADYFRIFPSPGGAHCSGGVGYFAEDALQALVDWVENDIVPDMLKGVTLPDTNGTVKSAPICPYPLVAAYKGGNIDEATSFECQPSF